MEFTLKTTLNATAKQIYSTWLSSEGHTNMTGGEASITDKIGGKFTVWDGYITGKTIELNPYNRILQSWRTSQFEEHEEDSILEILLNEINGETELTLIHSNVPKDGEHYKEGWENHYFIPMKAFLTN